MRVCLTGANGMLGSSLVKELSLDKKNKIFACSRSQHSEDKNIDWTYFDIADFKELDRWLHASSPDVLIHCAASVNVDMCEEEKEYIKKIHVLATKQISEHFLTNDKKLIYISTDSVFNGTNKKPYTEIDKTDPLNNYAKTKLEGEKYVLQTDNGVVLRTNIVGWSKEKKFSFFEWLLSSLLKNRELNLFDDVYFSPLNVSELSKIVIQLINSDLAGLFHCGSDDFISKYEFGLKTAEIFDIKDFKINRVSIESAKLRAKRPKNMSLNVDKIKAELKYNLPTCKQTIISLKEEFERFPNLRSKL